MNREIHTPPLEERVRAQIQSGQFQNTDELLTKALGQHRRADLQRWRVAANFSSPLRDLKVPLKRR
jgi:hypothetical protein